LKPSQIKVGFFNPAADFIFKIDFLNLSPFKPFHHAIFNLSSRSFFSDDNACIAAGK
jgi:hypothetical protein